MPMTRTTLMIAAALAALTAVVTALRAGEHEGCNEQDGLNVQLGPRPYYLIDKLSAGKFKDALLACSEGPFHKTDFSIGHRGATLQFPEHTKESYVAGARQGAGIVECDVTFTADTELVCRHSQCDLHTTTNILATPLAEKCSVPFSPAELDADGNLIKAASARCCTSDITLAEFKTLCGKMDASNPRATTVEEYLGGTPDWRTDLYTTYPPNPDNVCTGTLLTHAESIALFEDLGVKMTPELKGPSVPMPYLGYYTQEDYAQQMIDEYKAAGVPAEDVYAQSFNLGDVLYWIENEPEFGAQAVYLDDANVPSELPDLAELQSYAAQGVNIVAPPMWALVTLNGNGKIVPSEYARNAKRAGLDIITWTFERSAPVQAMKDGSESDYYYQTTLDGLETDGDILKVLDVIARKVGVLGIFSDWPATVTYYANCLESRGQGGQKHEDDEDEE